MIAVSSFRPTAESSEYAANQLIAKASWQSAFDAITYFNEPDDVMAGDKITFHPSDPYPRIKDMLAFLGGQPFTGCLINADIVVGPTFRLVEAELHRRGARAAFSFRWTFDSLADIQKAKLTDNGLDFFAATPDLWREAAALCPPDYRIGHCLFDTWIWCFLKGKARGRCWDITQNRVIFHPRHGGRRSVHTISESLKEDSIFGYATTGARRML